MRHNLFHNEQEYRKWARSVTVETDWLSGGGGKDWDLTQDLIKNKPARYPCITVSWFYNSFDRFGDNKIRLWEHVYLDEFNGSFDPYEEEKRYEREERLKQPYWVALSKWRDLSDKGAPQEQIDAINRKIANIRQRLRKKGIELTP